MKASRVEELMRLADHPTLRKYNRGFPIVFEDALAFWGMTARRKDKHARVDAIERVLCEAVSDEGSDARHRLLNLHRMLKSKFAAELSGGVP